MNNFIKITTGLLAVILIMSCEDFFEKDLEGKEVVIVSPADLLKTQYTTQNFWWEKMDGALTYNLQIASPSFSNIEKLLLDTNISVNKLSYALYPGKFEWRLCAENASSKGKYTVRSLEIDTTLDLRGQEVLLKYPPTEFATRRNSIKFLWGKLYNADDYRFELKAGDWTGARVINPVITKDDTITVGALAEGAYYWGVQAQNNGSVTVYAPRRFFVDNTNPQKPNLSAPTDSAKVASWPVTLKWESVSDGGSAIHDSLVVATDKSFKTASIKLSERVDGKSQSVNYSADGKYFWKVYSVDAAGNVSPASEVYLFIVGNITTTP